MPRPMEPYATEIGLLGVGIVMLAYGMYAAGKLASTDWRYPLLNIAGTVGILISLLYQWNLPSFVIQIVWIALSLVGLARIFWRRHRHG